MSKYLTEPGQERIAQPTNTGDVEIETITITLGDGTVLLITRDTHSYRMSVIKRGGEEVASRTLPQSTLTVGKVLNGLGLEAQTRATLFTLLTLRSFVSPG
jgi:hypothetical protein